MLIKIFKNLNATSWAAKSFLGHSYFQQRFHILFRTSCSQMLFKTDVLKNFGIFTRKYLRSSLFLIKLQALTLPVWTFSGLLTGRGGRGQKAPLLALSFWYTYPTMIKLWRSHILRKGDPKNIWITWHTAWVLLTSSFFSPEISILLYQEIQI